jgi:hypothetical protein
MAESGAARPVVVLIRTDIATKIINSLQDLEGAVYFMLAGRWLTDGAWKVVVGSLGCTASSKQAEM